VTVRRHCRPIFSPIAKLKASNLQLPISIVSGTMIKERESRNEKH